LRPRKKKKVEVSDEVMNTENKILCDNSTLSPYQIALTKSIWYFFSNVTSWFSSKVHKQSVVMSFVLDENDFEVKLAFSSLFRNQKACFEFLSPHT
jgi:hypothetical protein